MQELIENYQTQHQDFAGRNQPQTWLSEIQHQSLNQLSESGFPTLRDENWRYTNIKPLLKQAFNVVSHANESVTAEQLDGFNIDGLQSLKIVVVDGELDDSLSAQNLPEGLELKRMSQMLDDHPDRVERYLNKLLPESTHGFMALNTAFVRNGIWIEIQPGAVIEQPIELLFISTGGDHSLVQPRNLFVAGENSQVKIIERYLSLNDNKTMTNTISEIYCSANATVEHARIQQESRSATHMSGTFVKLLQQAQFSTSTVTLGGNLTRNDLRCQIAGTGSHSNMYGLYATNQRQHVDNFTQVEHLVENCTSDELYKGVLDDRSRAVFHGRIYVAEDAQQTDAYQNNRTLLLSSDAEIDTKPQLEIYADDVKCSHGATIGQLNEEYLFYLRARGVENSKARRMLTFAFVKEALGAITIEPLKTYLEDQLDQQLLKGGHYGD